MTNRHRDAFHESMVTVMAIGVDLNCEAFMALGGPNCLGVSAALCPSGSLDHVMLGRRNLLPSLRTGRLDLADADQAPGSPHAVR